MRPLFITGTAIATAAGLGLEQTFQALRQRRSGLRLNDFKPFPHATWIGRVDGIEARPVAGPLADFDCRHSRVAQLVRQQRHLLYAFRVEGDEGVLLQGRTAIALGATAGGDA